MWSIPDDVLVGVAVGVLSSCLVMLLVGVARRAPSPTVTQDVGPCVFVSGLAMGLPGDQRDVFDDDNVESVLRGESRIEPLDEATVASLLKRNVVQLHKSADGKIQKIPIKTPEATIGVAARLGRLDLHERFGVPKPLCATMGRATQVAVAAGLEALRDAGLVEGRRGDLATWKLAEPLRDRTGIIYVSSFPALDAAVGEMTRYTESRSTRNASFAELVEALDPMCAEAPVAAAALADLRAALDGQGPAAPAHYTFDRKFLFKVLVLGNSQLAQLVGARGPNLQTNAACAGTTQAIGVAHDMLRAGRCDRVVVVAGDDASGDALMPWLGNGFVALGAASLSRTALDCARPFDARRNGMVLGAAGVGIVVERKCESPRPAPMSRYACRLVESRYSNSAYHGAAMDRNHIGSELEAFLRTLETKHGISRMEIARHGAYFSHETGTHATPSSSCASNEVAALRQAFGVDALRGMVIVNTKCLTGHPMGAGIEDAIAAVTLATGRTPPLPADTTVDALLGAKLRLATHRTRNDLRYALRFAAGFGSQVAFTLYERLQPGDDDLLPTGGPKNKRL